MQWIALLRGINVSGHKPLKMAALRESLTKLGLSDIQTYVQSGNIIFSSKSGTASALAKKIAAQIAKDFGYDVPVIIRSAQDWQATLKANPFLKKKSIDSSKTHVTFLGTTPEKSNLARLASGYGAPDEFIIDGQEIFLHCPGGYGTSKLSNAYFEKILAVEATTRNWKTISILATMLE